MPGVCYTFGWPYSIERSCHENFLSCGSLLLTSTNADADNQLAVYNFDGIHWSAASRIHTIHTVLAIFSTFNPICMFIYLFTSASSISTTTHNSYAIRTLASQERDDVISNSVHNFMCRTHMLAALYACLCRVPHVLFGIDSMCKCISRWREQSSACILTHVCWALSIIATGPQLYILFGYRAPNSLVNIKLFPFLHVFDSAHTYSCTSEALSVSISPEKCAGFVSVLLLCRDNRSVCRSKYVVYIQHGPSYIT